MRHAPNQDAIAMAAGACADGSPIAVACVSDGVSTSAHAEDASALAVEVACSHLADRLRKATATFDVSDALTEAFDVANRSVTAAAGTTRAGTWACTLVVAVVRHGRAVVANIGDSRSYWIPDAGAPLLLSTDDSMAQAQIDLGVKREVAEASSGAHAITKWLGPGSGAVVPSVTSMDIADPGWLLTCTDGLWNYASDPAAMAEVVREAAAAEQSDDEAPPAWVVCCQMIDWANLLGGHDNITVTLLRLEPTS